jgi:hypothetical protein
VLARCGLDRHVETGGDVVVERPVSRRIERDAHVRKLVRERLDDELLEAVAPLEIDRSDADAKCPLLEPAVAEALKQAEIAAQVLGEYLALEAERPLVPACGAAASTPAQARW